MAKVSIKAGMFQGVLGVLLALSISLNVRQGLRLVDLRDQVEQSGSSNQILRVGEKVGDIHASLPSGARTVIPVAAGKTPSVIYFFSPTCVWCKRNAEALNRLAERVRGKYQILGLALSDSGVEDFAKATQMTIPRYVDPDTKTLNDYKFGPTPETIVVAPGGKVLAVWSGAFSAVTMAKINGFFGTDFPRD
jgi:hypothetical protein